MDGRQKGQKIQRLPPELTVSSWPCLFPTIVPIECCTNQFRIEPGIGLAKSVHHLGQFDELSCRRFFEQANRSDYRESDQVVDGRRIRNDDAHDGARILANVAWSAVKSATE